MRGDIYVAGTGACRGQEVTVDTAIAEGLYDADEAMRTQLHAAAVASVAAPEMAVVAGRQALTQAARDASAVGVLFHLVDRHAGLDMWNSSTFIQRELGMHCWSAEIRVTCNSLMGLELACTYLAARPEAGAALVTAADTYPSDRIDRWRTTWGMVCVDLDGAVVLDTTRGWARLASVVTKIDPALEAELRGAERFGTGAEYIDLQARLNAFHRTIDGPELVRHKVETLQKVVADALQTAGVSIGQIDHVVVPHLGWAILRREFLQPLALRAEQTTWNPTVAA